MKGSWKLQKKKATSHIESKIYQINSWCVNGNFKSQKNWSNGSQFSENTNANDFTH